VLLLATSIDELIAAAAYFGNLKMDWIYHLFNPIEYTLLSIYYIKSCKQENIKKVVKISIPIFILAGLSISYYQYHFGSLPGLNINIEGFLLFILGNDIPVGTRNNSETFY
jgi:hypothetical protein